MMGGCEMLKQADNSQECVSIFDEHLDRRTSNCEKWSIPEAYLTAEQCAGDPLPMWVADMDFRAPPAVVDALRDFIDFGVFGYSAGATSSYREAVSAWQARRFGWEVAHDWIVPLPGTIIAIKNIIQAFSSPGDSVLIQPPVYGHFHSDPLVNGRFLAQAPLTYEDGRYTFDKAVFEGAIKDNTKIFILCNPHNPTGNVWSEDELRTMGEICARRGVLVISDEVHQDFIMDPARKHIPFASLGEDFAQNSITCTAPSKTFNLAGLRNANAIIPDKRLREELKRHLVRNSAGTNSTMGLIAAEAAYTHGEPWLEELLTYIRGNHAYFSGEMARITNKVQVLPAESLYLAWVDCSGLGLAPAELNDFMLTKARLWLDRGTKFGVEGGAFMRVNLGCPRATVREAVNRLEAAFS